MSDISDSEAEEAEAASSESSKYREFKNISVRRRIPAGANGPVFVMVMKTNARKRWEIPCADVPSSCPWIAYDLTEEPDLDAEDTEDGDVQFVPNLIRAYPVQVTVGSLQTYARSLGLLSRKGPVRAWFQERSSEATITHVYDIPRSAPQLRALATPALGQPAEFYDLLVHYPDKLLLQLSEDQLVALGKIAASGSDVIYSWDAVQRALPGAPPHFPNLTSFLLKRQPLELRHAVMALQLLHTVYVETGGSVFVNAIDEPERSRLLAWEHVFDPDVQDGDSLPDAQPQGKDDILAYTAAQDVENALIQYAFAEHVECHDFASWLPDMYAFAAVMADQLGAFLVCPDSQTVEDAAACGLPRDRVNQLPGALSGQLGTTLVVVRAERLIHHDLLRLCQLAKRKLVLIGDARQPHAFLERPGFFFGFALLHERGTGEFHPYPMDDDIWQRKCFDEIIRGSTVTLDVSNKMTDWSQIPDLVRPRCQKDTLFLCNTLEEREEIMRALSKHGGPQYLDRPHPGVRYTVPKTGYNGQLVRETPDFILEFADKVTMPSTELLRSDVSLLTQYMGVRCKHVIFVANEFTARAHIAAALKFADESFRIVFEPESCHLSFAALEPLSSVPRSMGLN